MIFVRRKQIYEDIEFYRTEVNRLEYELGLETDDVTKMRKRIDLATTRELLYESIHMLKENEFSSRFKKGCKKVWKAFLDFFR